MALALLFLIFSALAGAVYAGWQLGARKTELHWRNELAAANMRALQRQDLRKKEIQKLEESLVVAAEEAKALRESAKQELEKQRDTIPLSRACDECRIPRERLFLRKPEPGANRGSERSYAAKSFKEVAKASSEARVFSCGEKRIYSARVREWVSLSGAVR